MSIYSKCNKHIDSKNSINTKQDKENQACHVLLKLVKKKTMIKKISCKKPEKNDTVHTEQLFKWMLTWHKNYNTDIEWNISLCIESTTCQFKIPYEAKTSFTNEVERKHY